ncbi:uncharacterized protein LOC143917675 [Arctopsyche grandis]|uniref:uncharacterized protein LOC143917675 n=1 Tax=Arctopsyche grandis TaxID=121162 RepID=UPI00406D79DA
MAELVPTCRMVMLIEPPHEKLRDIKIALAQRYGQTYACLLQRVGALAGCQIGRVTIVLLDPVIIVCTYSSNVKMDTIFVLVIALIICMMIFTCLRCCKIMNKPNDFVTVTTVPGSQITAPYPVNHGAMPQPMYPGQPGVNQPGIVIPIGMAPVNYGAPYPPQNMGMPYPPGPNSSPYPPAPNNMPYPPAPNNMPYPPASGAPYPQNLGN